MRRPVDKLAETGQQPPRIALWAAIRRLREFRVCEVRDDARVNNATTRDYLAGLLAAGYLSRDGGVYTLVRDVGVEPPRVTRDGRPTRNGAASEAMWRAMRILRGFTARELAAHCSTPEVPISDIYARDYCRFLARAGYLRSHDGRYQMVPGRATGPRAPQIQRVKQVWDPHERRVVWPVRGSAS